MGDLIFVLFLLYMITRAFNKSRTKRQEYERRRRKRSTINTRPKTVIPSLPEKEGKPKREQELSKSFSEKKDLKKTRLSTEKFRQDNTFRKEKRGAAVRQVVNAAAKQEKPIDSINLKDRQDLVKGIVYSELLGKPRALNPWSPRGRV